MPVPAAERLRQSSPFGRVHCTELEAAVPNRADRATFHLHLQFKQGCVSGYARDSAQISSAVPIFSAFPFPVEKAIRQIDVRISLPPTNLEQTQIRAGDHLLLPRISLPFDGTRAIHAGVGEAKYWALRLSHARRAGMCRPSDPCSIRRPERLPSSYSSSGLMTALCGRDLVSTST
jgi:hypothetical protein